MKQLALGVLSLCISVILASAQTANLISYQGKLVDAEGQSLPNGTYRVGFRIWESASGGSTPVWAQKYSVPVTEGIFSVMLGSGDAWNNPEPLANSLALALSGTTRYLEVTVMSDEDGVELPEGEWRILLPRQALGAVPYAMNGVPVGAVMPFAGTVEPPGWAFCHGQAVGRTDPLYSALFAVIGTIHGTPPDGQRFNLPDYRGRFLRGGDWGTGRDPDRGARTAMNPGGAAGDAIGSVQGDQFASHSHSGFTHHSGSLHMFANQFEGGAGPHGLKNTYPMGFEGRIMVETDSITPHAPGDHRHGIPPDGGNETRPKNAYVNYIIKL